VAEGGNSAVRRKACRNWKPPAFGWRHPSRHGPIARSRERNGGCGSSKGRWFPRSNAFRQSLSPELRTGVSQPLIPHRPPGVGAGHEIVPVWQGSSGPSLTPARGPQSATRAPELEAKKFCSSHPCQTCFAEAPRRATSIPGAMARLKISEHIKRSIIFTTSRLAAARRSFNAALRALLNVETDPQLPKLSTPASFTSSMKNSSLTCELAGAMALPDVNSLLPVRKRCSPSEAWRWNANRHFSSLGPARGNQASWPGSGGLWEAKRLKINILSQIPLAAAGINRFPEEIRKLPPGRCRWTRIQLEPSLDGGLQRGCCCNSRRSESSQCASGGSSSKRLQIRSRRSPPRTLCNFASWRSKVRSQNQKLTGALSP